MGFISKFGEGIASGARQKGRQIQEAVRPKGPHETRLENLDTGYTVSVILVGLVVLGMVSGKGNAALVILVAMVIGCMKKVRAEVVPVLYLSLAPRMGWPSMAEGWDQDEAWQEERTQGRKRVSAKAPETAEADSEPEQEAAPVVESPRAKVLAAWMGLPEDRRKARALDVVGRLRDLPGDNSPLATLEHISDEEARANVAVTVLTLMAKTGAA